MTRAEDVSRYQTRLNNHGDVVLLRIGPTPGGTVCTIALNATWLHEHERHRLIELMRHVDVLAIDYTGPGEPFDSGTEVPIHDSDD